LMLTKQGVPRVPFIDPSKNPFHPDRIPEGIGPSKYERERDRGLSHVERVRRMQF
jgi:hypothetical protein